MNHITPSRTNTTAANYAFDNLAPEAQDRFAALEACFDPLTQAHLAARGVGPGWRCLEIGAGGGSIAQWLGSQVGQGGYVLATDLDTRWTTTGGLRQVEARRHDIVEDPLPAQSFDLIHTRLVLVHLPARDQVLQRLVASLRPGGWLVVEDFDSWLPHCLDPVSDDQRAFVKVGRAMVEFLRSCGNDSTYPRTLPHRLHGAGLADVGASGQLVFYTGGSPGSKLMEANLAQVGSSIIRAGLATGAEIDTARRLLGDPGFVANHPLLISAWGAKPSGT
jgi:SAM-dependent methyltransferase